MCLKLYLPKDSLLSIDQGPGSHKLWEHACGRERERETERKGEKVVPEQESERARSYVTDFRIEKRCEP